MKRAFKFKSKFSVRMENEEKVILQINKKKFSFLKSNVIKMSRRAKTYFEQNPNSRIFKINIPYFEPEVYQYYICDIFQKGLLYIIYQDCFNYDPNDKLKLVNVVDKNKKETKAVEDVREEEEKEDDEEEKEDDEEEKEDDEEEKEDDEEEKEDDEEEKEDDEEEKEDDEEEKEDDEEEKEKDEEEKEDDEEEKEDDEEEKEDHGEYLRRFAKELEIEELLKKFDKYDKMSTKTKEIYKIFKNDQTINLLIQFENILNHANSDNIEETINFIFTNLETIGKNSIMEMLFQILGLSFQNKNHLLIIILKRFQETIPNLFNGFMSYLVEQYFNYLSSNIKRPYYCIRELILENLLDKDLITSHPRFKRSPYVHFLISDLYDIDSKFISSSDHQYLQKKLEYHKKYCRKEGLLDVVFDFIRNDDVESFQTHIIQNNIDINAKYEMNRYNILNERRSLSCLEYSALYGSVKCFKYLISNQATINKNTLSGYAIIGNNSEIIHLCDENECSFSKTLKLSIQFHHHHLTEWLIENEKDKTQTNLIAHCIHFHNYKTLQSLFLNVHDINCVLFDSVRYNNYSLSKFFFPYFSYQINDRIEFWKDVLILYSFGVFN
ncbi:hypothetical protein TRFO_33546 [Tritrichomonas foetus]|uniref:DUF3447 domain-containing protein n=1 Tax=Tritrichomonas foetus TaxID=1144522 RepID=A0A1J4JLH8_9EUKA|nr:hypothetical protein TRFO_33546 [Tritrichomonas foetus]|eukprot:OHS99938.1 hypothetical protein TRFO_33546 [Tritrichomonas foetus]